MATFKPGNPTDPFPPNQPVGPTQPPTFPGEPTDPFPTPTPTPPPTHPTFPGEPTDPFPPTPAPTPTRPQALLTQVETQGAALDAGLRSVLDTLASTVGTTAQQSKAALDQVTAALRSQLKQTSGQQMQQLSTVVNQVVNAANSNATISQTALDSIVNTLAGANPTLADSSAVEVPGSQVTVWEAHGYSCNLTDPVNNLWYCTPGPGATPPTFGPAPPTPTPTPTPTPLPTKPPVLIGQPPAPAPPQQSKCNTCTITDSNGVWVQTFNNLSPADATALQNQVKMTPGYHITCTAMADQNCIPTINPPFWTPPGAPKPVAPVQPPPIGGGPGGGGGGIGGIGLIQAPGGGGNLIGQLPGGGGGGGGGGATFIQAPGGGGNLIGQLPGGGGGALFIQSPPPGGATLTGQQTGGGATLTGQPTPPGQPGGSAPSSPSPAPPNPPPPAAPNCPLPASILAFNKAIPRIGSTDWCMALPLLLNEIGAVGDSLAKLIPSANMGGLLIPTDVSPELKNVIAGIPFGIGDALLQIYQFSACVWDKLVFIIASSINAAKSICTAIVCGKPELLVGAILVRSCLEALQKLRIGWDGGFWATIDITVQWDQANAAIDYIIKYICPYTIPGTNEAMELYRGGWITAEQYDCWMKMQSTDPSIWASVLEQGRPRPGIHERQAMLWRLRPNDNDLGQSFNNAQYEASLRQDGYNEQWTNLLDAIKYNPYTLREIRQLLDSGVIGHDETLAAFQDMGFDPKRSEVLTQMELVLTKRRRESEIVGLTPARIADLYKKGKFKDDDVSLYMQALSYSENQAERLRQTARYENDAAAADHFLKAAISEGTTALRDAYTTGMVADADAVKNLMSLGAPQSTATALVQVWAATITTKNAKTGIAALKRGWDSGYMSGTAALINLEHTGLTNANAAATLAQWGLERAANEHLLTVQQVLNQVATGQTSAIDAAARLHNMGWYADDANILIANAESKLAASIAKQAESAAKAMAAAEKSAETQSAKDAAAKAKAQIQAAKAAEQLAKHGEAAMRLGEQQLKRITPVSTLQRWLKEGYISAAAFKDRMVLMGNPVEVADLMATEICDKKGAACVDKDGPKDNVLTDGSDKGGAGP